MRKFPILKKSEDPFFADLGLERWFEDFFKPSFKVGLAKMETEPAIDVYEKADNVVVRAEIPGVKSEDIKLTVDGNILTISGEKKEETETKKEDYYRTESYYGAFRRAVELPADVKAGEARASYKGGVLKVELPKEKGEKKKEIKIQVN
jgi:HSP20 family protein